MRTIASAGVGADQCPTTVRSPEEGEGHVPAGLDPWLVAFIEQTRRETEVLAANGVAEAVAARRRVLGGLVEAARAWLQQTVEVAEAAILAECCEETIRRKVRRGELAADRAGQRGRYRIPRAAARALATSPRVAYDANADARDIAKLLRRLG